MNNLLNQFQPYEEEEQLENYLDALNDYNYLKELTKMYQFIHSQYPEYSEDLADYVEGQLTDLFIQRGEALNRLEQCKQYKKETLKMTKKIQQLNYTIAQKGLERSVLRITFNNGETSYILINNDLMDMYNLWI